MENHWMSGISRRHFCKLSLAAGTALATGGTSLAAPAWVDQRQVGPFVCMADFPLVNHEALLAELAPLEKELRRVLGVRPCQSTIYLHLLADQKKHQQYLAERFPSVPYRRALFVKQEGRSSLFAYLHKDLAIDVRHESTHALLHADLPMVPLWLDEGLAEYFEVPQKQRFRQNPHLRTLRWDLRLGRIPNMAELEAKRELQDLSVRDYRFAWAWTHFMLHGPAAGHAELVAFLNDIRRREAPGQLSERLERVVPNSADRLVWHFKHLAQR